MGRTVEYYGSGGGGITGYGYTAPGMGYIMTMEEQTATQEPETLKRKKQGLRECDSEVIIHELRTCTPSLCSG